MEVARILVLDFYKNYIRKESLNRLTVYVIISR